MTPRSPIRFVVERRAPPVSLLALVFGGHVALGAMILAWVQRAEPRVRPTRVPTSVTTVERLLFVERASAPTARTPRTSARLRTPAPSTPTAFTPASPDLATISPTRDTASISDAPVRAPLMDDTTAVRGLRPSLRDSRLWAPAASRDLFGTRATPRSMINNALTPILDSLARERDTSRLGRGDWTMTDARGRKWGVEPGGIRLGQFRLDIQPPAATDLDRAQRATRADIQRFRHMIPGDADFNRLKADLRRQREEAHQKPSIPRPRMLP